MEIYLLEFQKQMEPQTKNEEHLVFSFLYSSNGHQPVILKINL